MLIMMGEQFYFKTALFLAAKRLDFSVLALRVNSEKKAEMGGIFI
jgi:hypothetical protein